MYSKNDFYTVRMAQNGEVLGSFLNGTHSFSEIVGIGFKNFFSSPLSLFLILFSCLGFVSMF